MESDRFVVRELEGDTISLPPSHRGNRNGRPTALEVNVLDTLDCYRRVGRFVTSDGSHSRKFRRARVRADAAALAAGLNAEHQLEVSQAAREKVS